MNIYIDYDDCLCETARNFSDLVKQMFDKDIPYENIRFFNLKESFDLTDDEYEQIMVRGHSDKVLLSYEETPGAVDTVNEWIDSGYNVSVITGRPHSAYAASRQWLDEHNLKRVKLYHLNKYGRDSFIKDSDFDLELDEYYKMHFDYAIEDSPMAFGFFNHLPDLKVLVYDRPWNKTAEFPDERFIRQFNWNMIKNTVG